MRDRRQDYAGPGAWFITINASGGRHIFGCVIDRVMRLNPLGQVAHDLLQKLPSRFPHTRIDQSVVMPNHVHVILWLVESDPRLNSTEDCVRRFSRPVPGTVGTIINLYKGSVTRAARQLAGEQITVWQDQFVDIRIRSRDMLNRKRRYIRMNPERWQSTAPSFSRR